MKILTKRFGLVEVDPSKALTFPDGLIGFSEYKDYLVIDLEAGDGSLKLLQSIDEPTLEFVILDPRCVFLNYDPELYPNDLAGLQVDSPDELMLLVVVTVPKDVRKMTANLQAPLVVNPKRRLGKQVVLASPEYTTKHSVLKALASQVRRTG
ncbi:MAG: flagellar assembly protein FliW [Bacillota bacterium]|jgi:flagellar assembly factor FliW|nr:flagellar assembly protein FliW [Candidatus Fermentithermobacillaceae bacterium]